MGCQTLKASTSKNLPWADAALTVMGAIPMLNVGIVSGKGFVMTFPLTINHQ
jgi:nitrate reductase NapE component